MNAAELAKTPPEDPLRVLIVDDNIDHAIMLAELVKLFGYLPRVAHSATQAATVCAEFKPRVILLDLGLPDEHGYTLAKRLREVMGPGRKMTFVAVTGWMQIADQLQSSAAGISHHLVKPVNREALRAILDGYAVAHARNSGAVNQAAVLASSGSTHRPS